MNPDTGRVITYEQLQALRVENPLEAEKFSVELAGNEADIMRISAAVKAARRAENKRARKARRNNRSK